MAEARGIEPRRGFTPRLRLSGPLHYLSAMLPNWWTGRASNPQPPACGAGALPIELRGPSTTHDDVSDGRSERAHSLLHRAKPMPTRIASARALAGPQEQEQRRVTFQLVAIAARWRSIPVAIVAALRRRSDVVQSVGLTTAIDTRVGHQYRFPVLRQVHSDSRIHGWGRGNRTPDLLVPGQAPCHSAIPQSGGSDRSRTCILSLTGRALGRCELQSRIQLFWRRVKDSNLHVVADVGFRDRGDTNSATTLRVRAVVNCAVSLALLMMLRNAR